MEEFASKSLCFEDFRENAEERTLKTKELLAATRGKMPVTPLASRIWPQVIVGQEFSRFRVGQIDESKDLICRDREP
ncbi:MAG: hypothetical protein ACRD3S_07470, partial [Terracidiphilus sp.]